MIKFILAILLSLSCATQSMAFGFGDSVWFSFDQAGSSSAVPVFHMPLTSSIELTRGQGSATFTRASTQWGTNDAGALVSVASNVPFFNTKGIFLEPASTNKCTNYNVIPADSIVNLYTSNFSAGVDGASNQGGSIAGNIDSIAGQDNNLRFTSDNTTSIHGATFTPTATVGKRYSMTFSYYIPSSNTTIKRVRAAGDTDIVGSTVDAWATYTSTFFNAPRTSTNFQVFGIQAGDISASFAGTTGDLIYIRDVIITEQQYYTGTKSYWTGAAFQNNFTNATLSGDAAAMLSIADATANLVTAGLQNIAPSGKVYKLDNSAGAAAAYVDFGGAMTAVATTISVYGDLTAGTAVLSDENNANSVAISTAYARVSKSFTATATKKTRIGAAAASTVYFILNQLEEVAYPTSPIVVQGADATRAACILSINQNVPSPLTLFAETTPLADAAKFVVSMSDGTANNRIQIRQNAGATYTANISAGGVAQASITIVGTLALNSTYKVAMSAATNDVRACANGVMGAADTAATMPVTDQINIGGFSAGAGDIAPSYVKNVRIYNKALSNGELIRLTR